MGHRAPKEHSAQVCGDAEALVREATPRPRERSPLASPFEDALARGWSLPSPSMRASRRKLGPPDAIAPHRVRGNHRLRDRAGSEASAIPAAPTVPSSSPRWARADVSGGPFRQQGIFRGHTCGAKFEDPHATSPARRRLPLDARRQPPDAGGRSLARGASGRAGCSSRASAARVYRQREDGPAGPKRRCERGGRPGGPRRRPRARARRPGESRLPLSARQLD